MITEVEVGDAVLTATAGFASGQDIPSGTLQVRMHNVTSDGAWDWSTLRRVPASPAKLRKYSLEPQDVLFNSTNSPDLVGKAALFTGRREPVVFSNHFLRLRVDPRIADPGYLARWLNLQWRRRRFETLATRWVNQAAVRKEDLLALRLELPDLKAQREATELLDSAARLCRVRRFELDRASEFLPAVYVERFSGEANAWPESTIEELCEDRKGSIRTGPFGSQLLHSEFTDHGIAVLGIDNAVHNRFEWVARRYITPQKFDQLRRYQVHPDDVLITIMATCGRCAVVPKSIETAINTKHLCCISLDKSRMLPAFLHGAFLYDPSVRRQMEIATKGAIMDGLNMEIIKELRVPVPPMDIQEEYQSLAASNDRLFITCREALRQATHLFDSLLAKVVPDAA